MNKECYKQITDLKGHFPKLVVFVQALMEVIPLASIDINDWQCNTSPGVYVHNKQNHFRMKRYCRCAKSDVARAIKFYYKGILY